MAEKYLNNFKGLFFYKKFISILKYNFVKRLFTTFFLLLIFYIIRTSSILLAQCIFSIVFLFLLWELKKSFNIRIELLIVSKLIILIEFFFNISGSNPNIFLYISAFRFLLLVKNHF